MIPYALLWLGAAVVVGLTVGRAIRAGAVDLVMEETPP